MIHFENDNISYHIPQSFLLTLLKKIAGVGGYHKMFCIAPSLVGVALEGLDSGPSFV